MIKFKLRVSNELKKEMERYNDINWSAVAIKAIRRKLDSLEADRLAAKSKLTEKDVEDFSRKIKAAAAKRFLDEHPSNISKKELVQAKKLALASEKNNLYSSEKELFRKLRRK